MALHREWMIRAFAVGLAVATIRPIIGIFFATSRVSGLTPRERDCLLDWVHGAVDGGGGVDPLDGRGAENGNWKGGSTELKVDGGVTQEPKRRGCGGTSAPNRGKEPERAHVLRPYTSKNTG